MKWTSLRLNMLPITAVEIQYACQTLTNIHNALVDSVSKQSLISIQKFHIKPLFNSSETFLSQSGSKSQPVQTNKKIYQTEPMTYQKLSQEYRKLKQQMLDKLNELKKFYTKNSHDQSASLFHMLRLKLQRCLFDCNFQKNQTKKVMTKAEQEMKYNEIARHFDSNRSKNKLSSISQTQQEFVESCETFKTENYTENYMGYNQDQSIENGSKNQFLHFQDDNYEELFSQPLKVQDKRQYSKSSLNPVRLQKRKNSKSNTQKNSKQTTQRLSSSKIPLKREPNSQITIAMLNERELSNQKINLNRIQNEQKNYKNLKVLTNNNSSQKNINNLNEGKQGFNKQSAVKIQQNQKGKNNIINQQSLRNTKNNEKVRTYSTLNQKKQEKSKIQINQQKQKNPTGNERTKQLQKAPSSPLNKSKGSKTLNPNQQSNRKTKTIQVIEQQQQRQLKPVDSQDLKQILMSKGSQLRFTIKMSRQQYKSLLELKSKINDKKHN